MKRSFRGGVSLLGVLTALALMSACDETAAGVSATASSNEGGYPAAHSFDGLTNTRWSSAFEDNQWLAVDLGEPTRVHSVLLKWEDAYARSFGIEISDNGENWTEVYATTKGRGGDEVCTFEPVTTRWIRIDLRMRATEWGFSLYEVELNPELRHQRELIANVMASSGDRDYAPELAIDNDSNTRWSSIFTDDEWWQVEFKEPQTVGGMNISWEQAFAENYTIEVSRDGQNWQTVYTVFGGDGRTDLLFFEPVETKFVRIDCTQRGTGWGNSIWEVDFFLDDQVPELSATSSGEEHPAHLAMDGQNDTYWRSANAGEQIITARLPEAFSLGGVVLAWADAYPAAYRVEGSVDGASWKTLVESGDNAGDFDYHFFSATPAQFIRVVCQEPANGAEHYELAGIELKGGDEQATPLRHYTARARDAHPERYPMWLSRQQEFWTITGLPEEEHETLLGETGMTEPKKGSFGVQPFVVRGDSDIVTWADVELEQHLAEDYLPVPSVTWKAEGWKLHVETIMSGPEGSRFSAVRYRLINESDEPFSGKLALAIRPIQLTPGWQHGGFSPIRHATFAENNRAFLVDGEKRIELVTKPLDAGVAALSDMEVGEAIKTGTVPVTRVASDDEGKVGAAVTYTLDAAPGETVDVVIAYPLHDGATFPAGTGETETEVFDRLRAEHTALWKGRLEGPVIDIPEKRFIDVLKSNLGYIMINRDGPFFKPGPRNYNHAWMRDGVLTGLATLRWGITDMVHDFIIEFAEHIRDDGWVPWLILESGNPIAYNTDSTSGEGQEYDSQGQFPFIVRQYYDYTGDEELVRKVYPKVVSALKFARMLRERRMTDEYLEADKVAYYGILPLSNSHEGYYPAKHSHWDNFWLIRGLKDAIYLADTLGHEDDAAWFRTELADVREKLYASIMTTIRENDMDIIPGCVELADTDPTSTSIAIMIAGEEDYLPQPYGSNTFEHYWGELHSRMQPGGMKLFTPYEVRNGDVFIRMGWRDRALAQFRRFTIDSTRPYAWNHMAEVVHATLRAPAYIGDMPHTWVGADYINAVRTMVAYEHGDVLVLAAGIDPAWLVEGVRVRNLPTQFGTISYEMKRVEDRVEITIGGDADPAGGIKVPVPESISGLAFIVNGEPVDIVNGAIVIGGQKLAADAPDEEDPLVLEWLRQVQDTATPEQQLLSSMEGTQLQTFNNALAALAFIVKDEQERAERILDVFADATDPENDEPLRQNFFYNGEARGFFQYVERVEEDGDVIYRGNSDSDRWMGDMCWLLFAYKHYEQQYGRGRYDEIVKLLHDLLVSWYTENPDGPGGYVQHGWRKGDEKLHEDHGHHEGNIDAYAYFKMVGLDQYASQIRAWIEGELTGDSYPLDLYTWRAMAYEPEAEAANLALVPHDDARYVKEITFNGKDVTGVWHSADESISDNIWIDGVGHMACAMYAAGLDEHGDFYSRQLDKLLIDREINGVATRSLPYTVNQSGGYDWVDPDKGFASAAAWYIYAKNKFNPMGIH